MSTTCCAGAAECCGDGRLPRHLDLMEPPLAECNGCHRKTWSGAQVGTEDRMTQPDGNPCGGRFEAPSSTHPLR